MENTELDQYRVRLKKRADLLARSLEPYPARTPFERSHAILDVINNFKELVNAATHVIVVGRIRAVRAHGNICFADIEDGSGIIQISLSKKELGEELKNWTESIDLGDFVTVVGLPFQTGRGEKTLQVKKFALLAKSLMPLPDKRKGLTDTETRFRHRELDILTNPESKNRFLIRARLIKSIRDYLDAEGFLEVETPTLQTLAGGTSAKPFKTYHEALNADLYLRIAPELYLKRLLVGGFERVYEFARCFRNEGIDKEHSPEFTQVEFYLAYADYLSLMDFTEKMFSVIMSPGHGIKTTESVDFGIPFTRLTYRDAFKANAKLDIERFTDKDGLANEAEKRGVEIDRTFGKAKILDAIFKTLVRPKIIKPTFVYDLPIELSPLAKKKQTDGRYAERFQLLINGVELANAFSELNDPIDQNERFIQQQALRDAGDDEAQPHDKEYVEALNYGMPPAAGIGIGIDRLVAIITNAQSLREVILFPTLRKK